MSDEMYKGGVHFVASGLFATMGLYNLGEACSERREPKHVVNAVAYAVGFLFEGWNTYQHWRPRPPGA